MLASGRFTPLTGLAAIGEQLVLGDQRPRFVE